MSFSVLMVIRTAGLEYDDRLRKECETIRRIGGRPRILAVVGDNVARRGRTGYDVPYRTVHLPSRRFIRSGTALTLKTAELNGRLGLLLRRERAEVLWIHDMELAGLLPLAAMLRGRGRFGRLIWDQHELPPEPVLNMAPLRTLLAAAARSCDAVVVASRERKELLSERIRGLDRGRLLVIENLADRTFAELPGLPLLPGIRRWVGETPFLLSQGGAAPGRYLGETVEAVMGKEAVKLVVVGSVPPQIRQSLEQRWGERLRDRVLFSGPIPQMELHRVIDHALASVVLYSRDRMNGDLCAPNRLHQAAVRGVPVLVGSNPPLSDFVARTGAGIRLTGDGRDPADIAAGIDDLLARHAEIHRAAARLESSNLWEDQQGVIARVSGVPDRPSRRGLAASSRTGTRPEENRA